MTAMSPALKYRRLRAPTAHGAVLVDPPLADVKDLVRSNEILRDRCEYDCQGRSLHEIAATARRELIQQAVAYTSSYRNTPPLEFSSRVFLTGHQPELFHAGVWSKNFASARLAQELNAVAICFLIDSDPLRRAVISVPTGSIDRPRVQQIAYDRNHEGVPYEERSCFDQSLFQSFGDRVTRAISPLVTDPLINQYWPLATEAILRHQRIGLSIAQARHQFEGRWGLQSLEIPWSIVCDSEPFLWFVAHLLAHFPRFWNCYNTSLNDYRCIHRLRNRAQPMPDLVHQDEWLEAPFWIWTDTSPLRRRVFVRDHAGQLQLTDRQKVHVELPLSVDDSAEKALEKLVTLRSLGIKLRPRALITTLFARLVLSDLFVHGIGGAKYDQLTDQLISVFFGLQPPAFLTLSATLWLPVEAPIVEDEDFRRVDHQLRELQYHPENHIDFDEALDSQAEEKANRWIESKQLWIAKQLPRGSRRGRHQAICRANAKLQPYVAEKRTLLERERTKLAVNRKTIKILTSREYAFCLFPENFLRNHLL